MPTREDRVRLPEVALLPHGAAARMDSAVVADAVTRGAMALRQRHAGPRRRASCRQDMGGDAAQLRFDELPSLVLAAEREPSPLAGRAPGHAARPSACTAELRLISSGACGSRSSSRSRSCRCSDASASRAPI